MKTEFIEKMLAFESSQNVTNAEEFFRTTLLPVLAAVDSKTDECDKYNSNSACDYMCEVVMLVNPNRNIDSDPQPMTKHRFLEKISRSDVRRLVSNFDRDPVNTVKTLASHALFMQNKFSFDSIMLNSILLRDTLNNLSHIKVMGEHGLCSMLMRSIGRATKAMRNNKVDPEWLNESDYIKSLVLDTQFLGQNLLGYETQRLEALDKEICAIAIMDLDSLFCLGTVSNDEINTLREITATMEILSSVVCALSMGYPNARS